MFFRWRRYIRGKCSCTLFLLTNRSGTIIDFLSLCLVDQPMTGSDDHMAKNVFRALKPQSQIIEFKHQ